MDVCVHRRSYFLRPSEIVPTCYPALTLDGNKLRARDPNVTRHEFGMERTPV